MGKNDLDGTMFAQQEEVLASTDLLDADKLFFCRHVCDDGFRSGWLLSTGWTPEERDSIGRLAEAGFLNVRREGPELAIGRVLHVA